MKVARRQPGGISAITHACTDLPWPGRADRALTADQRRAYPAPRGRSLMGRPAGQRLFNVPTELSSFVGRRAELAEGRRLLRHAPLLTPARPGGVGKTKLALRPAA